MIHASLPSPDHDSFSKLYLKSFVSQSEIFRVWHLAIFLNTQLVSASSECDDRVRFYFSGVAVGVSFCRSK